MDKSKTSRKRRNVNSEDMGSSCCKEATTESFTEQSALNKQEPSPNISEPSRNMQETSPTKKSKKGKNYRTEKRTELEEKVQRLQREIDWYKQAAEDEKKQKHEADENNTSLTKQLKDAEKANEEREVLRKKLGTTEKELGEKTLELESLRKANGELEVLREKLGSAHNDLGKKTSELESLREKSKKMENSTAALKKQLDAANEQNSNLLNRMSELAGAKLSAGNPNLVDISDENRPTKLAERYNELYDNDWTDAFDILTSDGRDDVMAINMLRNILTSVYNECRKFTTEDMDSFHQSVLKRFRYDENATETIVLLKQYTDRRKKMYTLLEGDVKEKIQAILKTISSESERASLKKFIEETSDICMLMCLQDPLVVIESDESGKAFDTSKYKAYTTSGKYIDYVVWPALRLHQDGPLLGKGIAQGRNYKDWKDKKGVTQADDVPARAKTPPPYYALDSSQEVKPTTHQHTSERSDKHTSRQATDDANKAPRANEDQIQASKSAVLSTSGAQSTRKNSDKSQKKQAPLKPQTTSLATRTAVPTGNNKSIINVVSKGSTEFETTDSQHTTRDTRI